MNTRTQMVEISKFKLQNQAKINQAKEALSKKKNSYLAIRALKENLNSISVDRSPHSARLTSFKSEKENLSPLNKTQDFINENKQRPQNKNKKPPLLKPTKKAKDENSKKISENIGFKIFPKKQKNKKEEEQQENSLSNFMSFQDKSELMDITNKQNVVEISLNSNNVNQSFNFENDINVMTLKELKEENEIELETILENIEKKILYSDKNNSKIINLQQQKIRIHQEYQEIIKDHSHLLQNLQEEFLIYQEKNKGNSHEIEKIKKKKEILIVEKTLQNIQNDFLNLEREIKNFQDHNEEKSHSLLSSIDYLNEEQINYDCLLDFKRKYYDNLQKEITNNYKSFNEKESKSMEIDEKLLTLENLREKKIKLMENLQKFAKTNENLKKEKLEKLEEFKKKYENIQVQRAQMAEKFSEVDRSRNKFDEELKEIKNKCNDLANENLKANEELIKLETKKQKNNKKKINKNELMKNLEILTKEKKDLELKVKKLFDQKVKQENQKFSKKNKNKNNFSSLKEKLSKELKDSKNEIEKQNIDAQGIVEQLKTLKIQREEDLEMLESLKIGVSKQKELLSQKT